MCFKRVNIWIMYQQRPVTCRRCATPSPSNCSGRSPWLEKSYFGKVIEEKAKPLITFAPAWIRANAHLISDHRLTNVMWIPHCGMSDKMNAPRGRVLASNMERGVAFSVWSIHLLCQIRFAFKHLVKVSAVVGPDEREEKVRWGKPREGAWLRGRGTRSRIDDEAPKKRRWQEDWKAWSQIRCRGERTPPFLRKHETSDGGCRCPL